MHEINTTLRTMTKAAQMISTPQLKNTCFEQQVNNHTVLVWEIECMWASILQAWGLEQENRVDWDAQYHVLPNVLNLTHFYGTLPWIVKTQLRVTRLEVRTGENVYLYERICDTAVVNNHLLNSRSQLAHAIDVLSTLKYFFKACTVSASSPADIATFLARVLCSWGTDG